MSSKANQAVVAVQNPAFSFCIRIVDDEGHGVIGVAVKVWYKPGFLGVISWYPDITETDADGWAYFEKPARFGKLVDDHVGIDVKVGDVLLAEDLLIKDGDIVPLELEARALHANNDRGFI